jgi:hypothetical protein
MVATQGPILTSLADWFGPQRPDVPKGLHGTGQ